jgi:DNA-binding response OmpR family regulator
LGEFTGHGGGRDSRFAKGREEKIAALDAGADDYVTKPFESGELVARLRAVQRRVMSATEEPYFRGGIGYRLRAPQ